MAGRNPGGLPNFERIWSTKLGKELTEFLGRLRYGMIGLQGTPETPSEVQAGATADAGGSQAPAPSDHAHSVETAAPSVPVALGGAADEGSGSSLMRADATLVLSDGGANANDQLQWDGSAWIASDDLETMMWMGI